MSRVLLGREPRRQSSGSKSPRTRAEWFSALDKTSPTVAPRTNGQNAPSWNHPGAAPLRRLAVCLDWSNSLTDAPTQHITRANGLLQMACCTNLRNPFIRRSSRNVGARLVQSADAREDDFQAQRRCTSFRVGRISGGGPQCSCCLRQVPIGNLPIGSCSCLPVAPFSCRRGKSVVSRALNVRSIRIPHWWVG
jgi:hypothetical protein